MEDYTKTKEYQQKRNLQRGLKFVMFMRILAALVMVSSVFVFIWGPWLIALRILLTGIAAGLFLWGFYNNMEGRFYRYGKKGD